MKKEKSHAFYKQIQLRLVSLQVSKTLLNEIDYSLQYMDS